MCRLVSCSVYITFCLRKEKGVEGDIVGIGASSMPVGTVDCKDCADVPCMGVGIHKSPVTSYYGLSVMEGGWKLIKKNAPQATHFDPEDGGLMHFCNVGNTSHNHMVLTTRVQNLRHSAIVV